ncbi:MAG: pantetheine-phosphate adenylyltransferase [Clostridia bacterium]|nr:pantetheine-phosphate adenylyltransferase [Clostridia bacterium]
MDGNSRPVKHPGIALCVCPGSYDPVTNGHLDIIRRAQSLFGHVCAGVLDNAAKQYMFSAAQREQMLREAAGGLPGVTVVRWDGLLVDLLSKLGTSVIVRGIRSSADLAAEEQIALVNRQLRPGTETVFLPADPVWRGISSTIVRELIRFNADVEAFVPQSVCRMLRERPGNETTRV